MPNLRLSEADRERLGAPELLPFSVGDVTLREAIDIANLGYKTPVLFRQALFNRDEPDLIAWSVAVWLALRRAGIDVDAKTFDFNFDALAYIPDEPPVELPTESPGKARRPAKRSTAPTSTSGATSRAKRRTTSSPS